MTIQEIKQTAFGKWALEIGSRNQLARHIGICLLTGKRGENVVWDLFDAMGFQGGWAGNDDIDEGIFFQMADELLKGDL